MPQPSDVALVGAVALALAGPAPLPTALALVVDALGLTGAVLHRPTGVAAGPLAVAGDPALAVPPMRGSGPGARVLPLPGDDAVLSVGGAPASALPALSAVVAVLALALRGPDVDALLADADDVGDALADALHDGPVQTLVVARYACDAAVRGGDPAVARDAVQEAVVTLRRTMWHLRPRGADDLPAALLALSERRVEAGEPPLALDVDAGACARLAPAARALAYRLVQTVGGDVHVGTTPDGDVLLELDGVPPLAGPHRWDRRARALGGALAEPPGCVQLRLPTGQSFGPSPSSPTPSQPKARL